MAKPIVAPTWDDEVAEQRAFALRERMRRTASGPDDAMTRYLQQAAAQMAAQRNAELARMVEEQMSTTERIAKHAQIREMEAGRTHDQMVDTLRATLREPAEVVDRAKVAVDAVTGLTENALKEALVRMCNVSMQGLEAALKAASRWNTRYARTDYDPVSVTGAVRVSPYGAKNHIEGSVNGVRFDTGESRIVLEAPRQIWRNRQGVWFETRWVKQIDMAGHYDPSVGHNGFQVWLLTLDQEEADRRYGPNQICDCI